MFTAFIEGVAKPQGSKTVYARNNRVIMFEANKKLPEWRTHAIKTLKGYAPAEPITGAIAITLFFYFTKPKTAKRQHPDVKPDIDKLARAMLDALTQAAVIQDDCKAVDLTAKKRYSDTAGVLILIDRVE